MYFNYYKQKIHSCLVYGDYLCKISFSHNVLKKFMATNKSKMATMFLYMWPFILYYDVTIYYSRDKASRLTTLLLVLLLCLPVK